MKKTLLFLVAFSCFCVKSYSQEKVESENKEGRYTSLSKALKEPEKVISLEIFKRKDIPDSISVFKNLQKLVILLDDKDKLAPDIKSLKHIKELVIYGDANENWSTILCGIHHLEVFSIFATMNNSEKDNLEKCIDADSKHIRSIKTKEKDKQNRSKFNSVSEATLSNDSSKSLFLFNTNKDIEKINEIKNLEKFLYWSDRNKEHDFSTLSGSSTVSEVMIMSTQKLKNLDLSKFPNLNKLYYSVSHKLRMKEYPTGIEKLRSLNEIDLNNVTFSEEQVDSLKLIFPMAKIKLNGIVVQKQTP